MPTNVDRLVRFDGKRNKAEGRLSEGVCSILWSEICRLESGAGNIGTSRQEVNRGAKWIESAPGEELYLSGEAREAFHDDPSTLPFVGAEVLPVVCAVTRPWPWPGCSDERDHPRQGAGGEQPQRVPWLAQDHRYGE